MLKFQPHISTFICSSLESGYMKVILRRKLV